MKKGNVMLLAISGKVLAIVAREVIPVLLSVMLRDGVRKFLKKLREPKVD